MCAVPSLDGCTTPGGGPHSKPAAATASAQHEAYPALTTSTGIWSFLFLHWVESTAAWSVPSGRTLKTAGFRVVGRGHVRNWRWEILATKSLAPAYRRYRNSSPLSWASLMRLLRREATAVFGVPLPAVRFTIRMAPAKTGYSEHCNYVVRRTLPLCYAFPFPSRTKGGGAYWARSMMIASDYLSHETALALLMRRRLESHQGFLYFASPRSSLARSEALATLFNMFVGLRFAASDPHFRSLVIAPRRYGLTPMALRRMTVTDKAYIIGGQMAGLALSTSDRRLRVFCQNDRAGLRAYQAVLKNDIAHPVRLARERQSAIASLESGPLPADIRLAAPAGSVSVPAGRLLTKHTGQPSSSLGGVYAGAVGSAAGHTLLRDRHLYRKLCSRPAAARNR